jgi:F420-0:gamma-glutamyl ligase
LSRRERPVQFEMRRIETLADAVAASADLIEAAAAGDLPADVVEKFQAIIANQARMIEAMESEARVINLENNFKHGKAGAR